MAYFPGGVTLFTPGLQELYVFDTATCSIVGVPPAALRSGASHPWGLAASACPDLPITG